MYALNTYIENILYRTIYIEDKEYAYKIVEEWQSNPIAGVAYVITECRTWIYPYSPDTSCNILRNMI